MKNSIKTGSESYNSTKIFVSLSALAFFVLLKLGYKKECFQCLKERNDNNKTSTVIILLLLDIFETDYSYFNEEDLIKLLELLKGFILKSNEYTKDKKGILLDAILGNTYEIIKKEIKSVNIEINRDKEKVVEIVKYLNFDDKYNIFLSELDNSINTSNEIVTSGMISNFRSFIEDLLTDIAYKISSKLHEEIPKTENSVMGNIRKYLKIKLELSDADNQLINKYIKILHKEGEHSFIANLEYFRISKNIGIEIILLLLTKFEKLFGLQFL